jgi:hypothetical protein
MPTDVKLLNYQDEYVPSTKSAKVISHGSGEAATSPFPEYDGLVTEFVRERTCNPDAKISKSLLYKECMLECLTILAHTLVYYFTNDRYCQRIGRSHKSNGVYYLFNLKSMEIRQKCFDPDCRYYQSAPFHLDYSTNSSEIDNELIASLDKFEEENNLLA